MGVLNMTVPLSDHLARLLVRQVVTGNCFFDLFQLLRERRHQTIYSVSGIASGDTCVSSTSTHSETYKALIPAVCVLLLNRHQNSPLILELFVQLHVRHLSKL